MAREFTFSDPGEGIHEAEVVEVLVEVGDRIEEGDTVLVVETDKATTDLPSPYDGLVDEVVVAEGDIVEVDDVLLRFSDADAEPGTSEDDAAEPDATDEHAAEPETTDDEGPGGDDDREETDTDNEEPDGDDGGGRAAAVGELPSQDPARDGTHGSAAASSDDTTEEQHRSPVPASPSTRRLAREHGVDLREIEPTGEHGRVTADDVEAAAQQRPAEPDRDGHDERRRQDAEADRQQPAEPDREPDGPVQHVPLRGVRRTTARRLTASWQQIPHVTHHDVLDVTALERWRREHAPRAEEAGGDLTLMVLVMKALAGVLPHHPRFNATLDLDADELVFKRYYHLAFAVDTEDGLLVPVVRDVDRRPLLDLAVEVSDLIRRVRAREVDGDELRGGTFTITNIGPLGGAGFTPLIQLPQTAILGMGRARLEQVVTGDLDAHRTEVQFRLPLSLAYDHRVADGADAARFVTDMAAAIADPGSLLLTA